MTSRKHRGQGQRRTILVLTEGRVTERQYLKNSQRMRPGKRRASIKLGAAIQDPSELVKKAICSLADDKRRKEPLYDEIWCVFDYDAHFQQHSHLISLMQRASSHGISVAVSNPCFELWLVLHSQSFTKDVHRHAIQHIAKQHKLMDGKSIRDSAWTRLQTNYVLAKQRAVALDSQHQQNGNPPRSNPSSNVWYLVDKI